MLLFYYFYRFSLCTDEETMIQYCLGSNSFVACEDAHSLNNWLSAIGRIDLSISFSIVLQTHSDTQHGKYVNNSRKVAASNFIRILYRTIHSYSFEINIR